MVRRRCRFFICLWWFRFFSALSLSCFFLFFCSFFLPWWMWETYTVEQVLALGEGTQIDLTLVLGRQLDFRLRNATSLKRRRRRRRRRRRDDAGRNAGDGAEFGLLIIHPQSIAADLIRWRLRHSQSTKPLAAVEFYSPAHPFAQHTHTHTNRSSKTEPWIRETKKNKEKNKETRLVRRGLPGICLSGPCNAKRGH